MLIGLSNIFGSNIVLPENKLFMNESNLCQESFVSNTLDIF